jgi:hypothetical protein
MENDGKSHRILVKLLDLFWMTLAIGKRLASDVRKIRADTALGGSELQWKCRDANGSMPSGTRTDHLGTTGQQKLKHRRHF